MYTDKKIVHVKLTHVELKFNKQSRVRHIHFNSPSSLSSLQKHNTDHRIVVIFRGFRGPLGSSETRRTLTAVCRIEGFKGWINSRISSYRETPGFRQLRQDFSSSPDTQKACSIPASRIGITNAFFQRGNIQKCWEMFKIFGNVTSIWKYSKYLELFKNVWKCSKMFGNVRKCLEMFENVWKCSKIFGNVQKCLEMLKNVWQCSKMFGYVQTN